MGEVFRLDAKAGNGMVAIGKMPEFVRPSGSDWFVLELTRATAPWAFARGKLFRIIAWLELLLAGHVGQSGGVGPRSQMQGRHVGIGAFHTFHR